MTKQGLAKHVTPLEPSGRLVRRRDGAKVRLLLVAPTEGPPSDRCPSPGADLS